METTRKSPSSTRRKPKSEGIVVLGMHRSGTSACTRLLNLLGCALPAAVQGAAAGNQTGHWESMAAVELNEGILESAGSRWNDWGPINADWRASSLRVEMTNRASAVVRAHAELGPLFVLKDPRICRLADVWLDAMDEAGVEPLVLIMLRNPGEVAASLESRDLMSAGYGGLLWLRHVLDAEYLSRGRRRVHCTYEQLLTDWYGMIERVKADLQVSFPRNTPATHAEIDAFLSEDNRHHKGLPHAVAKENATSEWIRRTWAIFSAWSEKGEDPADHALLDDIRTEFDGSYGTFARLLIDMEVTGQFSAATALREQLSSAIAQAEEAAARADEAMRDAQERLRGHAENEAALTSQLNDGLRRAAALESDMARLAAYAARIPELEGEIGSLRATRDALTTEVSDLKTRLTAAKADADGTRRRLQDAEGRLIQLERELNTALQQAANHQGQLAVAQSTLAQRAEEISQLSAELIEATKAASVAESGRQREEEVRAAGERRLEEAKSEFAALKAKIEAERHETRTTTDRLLSEANLMIGLLRDESNNLTLAKSELKSAEQQNAQLTERLRQLEGAAQADRQARDQLEAKLAAQHDETKRVTALLASEAERLQQVETRAKLAEQEVSAAKKDMAALTEQCQRLEQKSQRSEELQRTAEQKLASRFSEVAKLTSLLSEELERAEAAERKANWLREYTHASRSFPKWWALMPRSWQRNREYSRYSHKNIFDRDQYLRNNPDVAEAGMDAMRHYLLHGLDEGRTWQVDD